VSQTFPVTTPMWLRAVAGRRSFDRNVASRSIHPVEKMQKTPPTSLGKEENRKPVLKEGLVGISLLSLAEQRLERR